MKELFNLLTSREFWKRDKQLHFVASAVLSAVGMVFLLFWDSTLASSFWAGIGLSLTVGIIAEAIDKVNDGVEDINDVYADLLGAIAGSLLVLIVVLTF